MRRVGADKSAVGHAEAVALLDALHTVPAWVDAAAIARGQETFNRYGLTALPVLLCFSLVGGFGAPKINKGSVLHYCARE